ncbi:hypothetical protein IWW36_000607 [Coemansia brasiliensis]|uniref:Uncharacterized protein n=1 Tax=Coemansia brasiliensis TaxID=2650707 RepID=A0A9W8IH23_9FUNG|nr:hypothetical protein IWW36_000607 [Coemansia brasiliensis]
MYKQLVSTHLRALFAYRLTKAAVWGPLTQPPLQRCYHDKPDLDKEIEAITDLATTAKDEMDFAMESRNSVYYNEDKKAAHEAVDEMAQAYAKLLDRLSAADKQVVETRIGMKIKEIQSAYEIMTLSDIED